VNANGQRFAKRSQGNITAIRERQEVPGFDGDHFSEGSITPGAVITVLATVDPAAILASGT
jgi:hypothetical protein